MPYTLAKYEVTGNQNKEKYSEQNYIELFISAKRIEGCSEKSLKYYKATIEAMLDELQKDVKHIVTDDIRGYLTEYQEKKKLSKVTLFPELEHQLSYIKYANRNLVNPVTDFTKYEEESASNKQDIGVKQPELEQYILDNFYDQFKGIIGEEDVKEVLNIIKEHFTVDWYKRNPILSKINMSITGYYFKKCQSRDAAKQKAEQIVTLLNQMVKDFITATDERGE